MLTQKELRATMSKKLQEAIKHTDHEIAAGRKSAIKRWVGVLQDNFMEHIKYFKGDKLKFLHNVFQDEGCWSGTRLNNAVLGQRFTEEKIGGIDNPLRKYEMACSYCVVDKILPLFQKRFEFLKSKFPPGKFDGKTETEIDKYVRDSLLDTIKRNGPVFDFWIDRGSGKLKKYDAVEGFDSAVKLEWSEGVEYFYNHLKEEDKEKKLTEAILALSRVQSVEKDAPILDFCIRNVGNKDTILQKLSQKDKGVYSLFAELIDSCFFDTVHDLVQCWCYKEASARGDSSEKTFSQDEYDLLLYSLSNVMLKNPESSTQARSLIMKIWKCDCFIEYRKISVNISNCIVPIQDMLAGLIINWKREDIYKSDEEKEVEKKEILDVMLFAKDCFPEKFEFFEELITRNLRLCGRKGKKVNVDYGLFAEELFSELEKPTSPPRDDGSGDHRRRSIVIVEAEDSSLSIRHGRSGDEPESELESPGVISSGSRKRKLERKLLPAGNYSSGDEPESDLTASEIKREHYKYVKAEVNVIQAEEIEGLLRKCEYKLNHNEIIEMYKQVFAHCACYLDAVDSLKYKNKVDNLLNFFQNKISWKEKLLIFSYALQNLSYWHGRDYDGEPWNSIQAFKYLKDKLDTDEYCAIRDKMSVKKKEEFDSMMGHFTDVNIDPAIIKKLYK
ncbi:cytoplasmic incompatibility factor CifA [Wolbachia endosymbiont (group B) of Agrotis puta]|uniref:cytoplasmic incompatibility factor CifA n=1 Tax=Wolbachia endosymbiont (group B) of Agrotis puta TaxID=3066162 RepID=UPI00333EBC4F